MNLESLTMCLDFRVRGDRLEFGTVGSIPWEIREIMRRSSTVLSTPHYVADPHSRRLTVALPRALWEGWFTGVYAESEAPTLGGRGVFTAFLEGDAVVVSTRLLLLPDGRFDPTEIPTWIANIEASNRG